MGAAEKILESMERSSWIRKMFEAGAEMKAEYGADNVYDFSLGNPNLDPPEEFLSALRETAAEVLPFKHAYMPNAGYPDVRKAVAEVLSEEQHVQIEWENLIMTCGAGGALNVALKTILNPGDEVIASTPCFMEYSFYAANHGGSLILADGKDDFDIDVNAIEGKINKKTKAVIINSPNNPSGRIYPEASLSSLAEMLRKKNREIGHTIYIISDEPYRKIIYGGVSVPSLLKLYENTMICTSYSKELSIPGERIGWLAIHPDAEDQKNLVDGAVLCNRILGYVNAPALMQRVIKKTLLARVDIEAYRKKRDALASILKDAGFTFRLPEGTFYLFPEAPGGDDLGTVEKLRGKKILAVPGRGFGKPGYFRLSFCVSDRVIEGSRESFMSF
ncbi:MAG: pyridoxal phosphate-dependent aminotransferase [Spirochaetia bacterium]